MDKIEKAIEKIDEQIAQLLSKKEELQKSKRKELSLKEKLFFVFEHGEERGWIESFDSPWIEHLVDIKLENGYRHSTFNLKEEFFEDSRTRYSYQSLIDFAKVCKFLGQDLTEEEESHEYEGEYSFEDFTEAVVEIVEKGVKEFTLDW